MKPYLENANGNHFECRKLTRREETKYLAKIQEFEEIRRNDKVKVDETTEKLEELANGLLKLSYPELSNEQIEEILDFTCEEYGREQYMELLMYFVTESVSFQKAGGKVHPFLEQKKKEQEQQQTEENQQEKQNQEA